MDEAVLCPGCGCATGSGRERKAIPKIETLINTLSERLMTNSIIWLIIGSLQIVFGALLSSFGYWFLCIVGVLNIVSSIQDIGYSKSIKENSAGIVARFEPLTGPVIVLIYNLLIGGIIGVIGSVYYFLAIRSFVMENKEAFSDQEIV